MVFIGNQYLSIVPLHPFIDFEFKGTDVVVELVMVMLYL